MQMVSLGDSLHEMSKPSFWEKIRNVSSICHWLNLPINVVMVKMPLKIGADCIIFYFIIIIFFIF